MTKAKNPSDQPLMGRLSRRAALQQGVATAVGVGLLSHPALAQKAPEPIVKTGAGQVKGRLTRRVYVFRGIPYGASTAGAARFLPPAKPKPWTEVKDVLQNGQQCPQIPLAGGMLAKEAIQLMEGAFEAPTNTGEECLTVNVFSPVPVGDGKKRPVFVWLHGGGFASGSGGANWYDGSNLTRKNDVVVVTVNHRLNVFGHLYLGDVAPKYAESGNAGMLDIVAALQWVKDNIAGFGGDPANVTIAGESGGGMKVSVLMAMPAARGLFHKAVVMSGSALRATTKETAGKATAAFLQELGLKKEQVDQLQTLPKEKLLAALAAVQKQGHDFGPVVDGKALPAHPFDPVAPAIAADIPMMIGYCKDESRLFLAGAQVDAAGLTTQLKQWLKIDDAKAGQLIDAYKKVMPNASPTDLLFAITGDELRVWALTQAERKIALKKQTSVYVYEFAWEAPAFNGKYKAAHAVDTPHFLDNADAAPGFGGSMPDRRRLADRASKSIMTFAFTGSPSYIGLDMPKWPAYTTDKRSTMVFNHPDCKIVDDPDKDTRAAFTKVMKV